MNYIVNPMRFYWVQILNDAKETFLVLAVSATIAVLLGMMMYAINMSVGETNIAIKRWAKPAIIMLIISWSLYILLPSKETLILMMIAKHATYENAQWTVETIKSAVDYIVQAVQSIK
ncbi:MAG: hypothetical protein VB078_00365 [Clostridiaceae bacterium]|nr:hypothetical protein [Clostridiaceae bacterium]